MRSDTSLRPCYHPRGLILSTGELRPSGQSTVARMLQLDVAPGDIDLEQLTLAQQQLAYLPQAMTGYLQWLQAKLETGPAHWRSRWEALRAEQQAGLTNHTRHPEMYAHLMTAWETFLTFAVDVSALAKAEADMMRQEGGTFIADALNRQRIDDATEDPVQRFLGVIREGLAQKRVYLNSVEGERPAQAEQWGWVRVPIARNEGATAESVHPGLNAVLLGWVDEHFIYLLPDSAYRLAYASLEQAGTILLPEPTLWKRLVQQEYVQRGKRHYTREKRIQGVKHYVLFLAREKFLRITESLISGDSDDSDDN